jgi:hypothetical protein
VAANRCFSPKVYTKIIVIWRRSQEFFFRREKFFEFRASLCGRIVWLPANLRGPVSAATRLANLLNAVFLPLVFLKGQA